MQKLLYLVHRIPYPPNKGDKIRSYHFLRALAERYRVYLGSFVDDPHDQQYLRQLRPYCQEMFFRDLQPASAKLASLRGLLTGEALSLPYYRDRKMQAWVDKTLASQGIEQAVIFSSPMAQYLDKHPGVRLIADFVDVDSDKWRQYATGAAWPMNWLYRREAERLLAFERRIAARADKTLFVSEQEAKVFQSLLPALAERIDYVNNGVDSLYFNPEVELSSPYPHQQPIVVFTGAMDYWANVDAVCWFAQQVWPQVRQGQPDAQFYIVGSKPTPPVLQLAEQDASVIVTGRVDDVRPYLAYARLAVAPLRIARGVQNKVLEAMAMAKPLVVTSAAMQGIVANPQNLGLWVADQAPAFAECVLHCLQRADCGGADNRQFVQNHFSWQLSARQLFAIMENAGSQVEEGYG